MKKLYSREYYTISCIYQPSFLLFLTKTKKVLRHTPHPTRLTSTTHSTFLLTPHFYSENELLTDFSPILTTDFFTHASCRTKLPSTHFNPQVNPTSTKLRREHVRSPLFHKFFLIQEQPQKCLSENKLLTDFLPLPFFTCVSCRTKLPSTHFNPQVNPA